MIGREDEVALLDRFFAATDRLPAAMLLEGEPGVGKTTLWRCAVDTARQRSYRVLSSGPGPYDSQLSFVSLRDLFEDVVETAVGSLPVPQRRALAVALLREEPGPRGFDSGAVAAAFLGALRALAAERPVLVAVDDVQWLDAPTRLVLEFAVRRLRHEPVALLFASRSPGEAGAYGLLSSGLFRNGVDRVLVGPLSLGAINAVLGDQLGVSFPRPTLLRIYDVSGGNPFFAVEIGRALERSGRRLAPGEPLPVPNDVAVLVGARIGQLSPAVREALLAVAMLSNPTRSLVEAAMPRGVSARLRKAVELGVVELDETRIRFVHPMLASAVLGGAPPALRRRVHRRLAAVVPLPEERIRHLALAAEGPDNGVAAALDDAARGALARGAPGAAAELAEQARRLTPAESLSDGQRRSIEAADYHLHAGDTARGRLLLEEVVREAPAGDLRSAGLQALATVRLREESFAAAEETLEQALREVGDPSRRAAIELNLTVSLFQSGKLMSAAAHARAALALAGQLDEPAVAGAALTYLAMLEFLLGRGPQMNLVARAVTETSRAVPGSRRGLPHVLPPEFAWGVMLKWADEFDAGRSKLEALRKHAEEEQEEGWLPAILFHLGELACWLGDFELAGRYARDAHEAAQESGSPTLEAAPLALHALIEAHLGGIHEARSAAHDGLAVAERSGNVLHRIRCLAVLGFVELSVDDPAAAHGHFEPAAELAAASGFADPGVLRFVPDDVEALVALGRLDDAQTLLDEFEPRARSHGRRSALAAAGRCRGLLLAARGDVPGAVASLEKALVQHQQLSIPFERARTLLVLGTTMRRAKRKQRRARRSGRRSPSSSASGHRFGRKGRGRNLPASAAARALLSA